MSAGPASHRVTNELVVALLRDAGKLDGDILDMGAGSGFLTRLLVKSRARSTAGLAACDIDEKPFSGDGVPFTRCNVDEGLPYPDASFDAVAAIEVMEHTRSSYRVLGEIARVLKPGGMLIFSVPNVGHMLSRFSFAASGHYHMFPSPSTKPENAGRLCGHVAPLPVQYWHYGLRSAGFSNIVLRQDRIKKSAAGLAVLFWPALKLSTALHLRALRRRELPLYEETADVARAANSWPALASRSLVFSAQRP
ncbi:MAG: class I SAM-dependent methyltransferase [Bradyrhizobiaceae bacterium]|nr:class I SAM-dependent methyltransferase [Bradyrhizobiaceae bacterium]